MLITLDERKFYKLRTRPDDFIIWELQGKPGRTGGFALYLMEKKHLTTLEAVKIVVKKCEVPFRAIGFMGMKDKHALARQYITLPRRYSLNLDGPTWSFASSAADANPSGSALTWGIGSPFPLRKMTPRGAEAASEKRPRGNSYAKPLRQSEIWLHQGYRGIPRGGDYAGEQ